MKSVFISMTRILTYSVISAVLIFAAAFLVSYSSAAAQSTISASLASTSTITCPQPMSLWLGARGNAVSSLQAFLFARGYFKVHVTGPFGPMTRAAVKAFQRDEGLPMTGFVGPMTREHISRWCKPSGPVSISSLSPISGPVGTTVTVTGTGFTNDNTVEFGSGAILHVDSNGSTLTFTVPNALDPACRASTPPCMVASRLTTPGIYSVIVANQNGTSNQRIFTVTDSTSAQAPIIYKITPTAGPVGAMVTIDGRNFSQDNTIRFGNGAIMHVPVTASIAIACTTDPSCIPGIHQTIQFTVPDSIGPYCARGMMCAMWMQLVTPGVYQMAVMTDAGTSNGMPFTVTSSSTSSGNLSITGLDAPSTLAMGVSGTWTIHVSAPPSAGTLHYSVVWGDEAQTNQASIMAPAPSNSQTSASFTHAYRGAGTYTATFTVTDDAGHSVQTTSTITVTPWY